MRAESNTPRLEPAEGEATISGAIITSIKDKKVLFNRFKLVVF